MLFLILIFFETKRSPVCFNCKPWACAYLVRQSGRGRGGCVLTCSLCGHLILVKMKLLEMWPCDLSTVFDQTFRALSSWQLIQMWINIIVWSPRNVKFRAKLCLYFCSTVGICKYKPGYKSRDLLWFECSHWWKIYLIKKSFTRFSLQSECCNFNKWEHWIYNRSCDL